MSIPETISFDKEGRALAGGWLGSGKELVRKLFLALMIILVATLSFGIGRLTGNGAGEPVKIEYDPALATTPASSSSLTASASASLPPATSLSAGSVVASKSGSKYHYPSCPGAKQIKEANKITFASAQAAEAAGYSLAANCTAQ